MIFGIIAIDSTVFAPEAGIAATLIGASITIGTDLYNLLKPSGSTWAEDLTNGFNRPARLAVMTRLLKHVQQI